LRTRIETLGDFMTEAFSKLWIPLLTEIIDQCLAVFEEKIDREFWKSICKHKSYHGSGGGTFISGWINNLFPYTDEEGRRSVNSCLCNWKDLQTKMQDKKNRNYGRRVEHFSDTFCEAPVTWIYLGTEIPMKLKSGFLGPVLLDKKTLMPEITWVLLRK